MRLSFCQTPNVWEPRHTIHSAPSGYAAYITKALTFLGIDREGQDWEQYANWRPY